jgi:hypothetical protein
MPIVKVAGNNMLETEDDISTNIGVCTFIDGKSGSSMWIKKKEYTGRN